MLNRTILLMLGIYMAIDIHAQQWIDLQYTYDSLENVVYGVSTDFMGQPDTLEMDIYWPQCDGATSDAAKPLLMWIHGGSFLAGSKEDESIRYMCRQFARRGYVTATINYRLGFVSDDQPWSCNYPNYNCVFATDSAEWARAYYRAVQDAKGALRFLINRYDQFHINPEYVFVAGESAGSFTALGVALMDVESERPMETFATTDAPIPHPNNQGCLYNAGYDFSGESIPRPDLGGIDGTIEPTTVAFTIRAVGNMYGAMLSDLLVNSAEGSTKPGIYSFHRPCDIVVPIDSNYVDWGLTWCFTNGYNCYGITNNEVMLYGSRVFSEWNTQNNYGYTIEDDFATVEFPYSFLFGEGSCVDQVNNPCHAYDDRSLREAHLAAFFAGYVNVEQPCLSGSSVFMYRDDFSAQIYPNPASTTLHIKSEWNVLTLDVFDVTGKIWVSTHSNEKNINLDVQYLPAGVYWLRLSWVNDRETRMCWIKYG